MSELARAWWHVAGMRIGRGLRSVFLACTLGLVSLAAWAQEAGPDRVAFDAAMRAFDASMFARAATELEAMIQQFPDSPLKPAALERAAFARGEAGLAAGQFKPAAEAFSAFLKDYPASTNRLRGALREAYALQKAGDLAAVKARLEAGDGVFQMAVKATESPRELVFAGWHLLAEARLGLGDAVGALAALESGKDSARTPEAQWQRERLRHDAARTAGKGEERLAAAEALLGLAVSLDAVRRAEATSLAARAMEAVGQADRAEALWERNSEASLPAEYQREAVLRIAERLMGRQELAKSRARLERFLTGRPLEPVWHPVRLALGQVLFRQYAAARGTVPLPAEVAALPGQILGHVDAILTNQPTAELIGPVQYLRGWCLWEEGVGVGGAERLKESEAAFRVAAALLPVSAEQATARFKLGDVALLRKEPEAALTNYLAVAEGYAGDAMVGKELRPFAWQQAVVSAIAATNASAASRAMERLLATSPDAEISGKSALLVGQSLMRQGEGGQGRELLSRFAERFPEAGVTAEVRLALAEGYLADRQWTNVLRELDGWVTRYTNHPALPRAEYDRAMATAEAGMATNAVEQFRTLAQRFATNPLSQTAQLWLGDHFFNQGDFAQAELACIGVITNVHWKGTRAVQQARLKAGQAALERRRATNAVEYLLDLLNDRTSAEEERAPAYFYLGEARLMETPGTNTPLSSFASALEAFQGAARFTNAPIVIAAWGRMAYCHLQMGAQTPVSYMRASELYQRVADSPQAGVAARAKARIGLGIASERMAVGKPIVEATELLERALKNYLDVVLGSGFLRPGESVPPRILEEAGDAAGRLLEERRRFGEAAGLYELLGRELPANKPVWDARRERVRKLSAPGASASP
jgi:TolA-binding protein